MDVSRRKGEVTDVTSFGGVPGQTEWGREEVYRTSPTGEVR